MIDLNLEIRSDLVQLRATSLDDLEEIKSIEFDSEMWKYFTSDLSKEDELKEWLGDAVSENEAGQRIALTAIDVSSGAIVGCTSLANYSERDGRIEIGWTWVGAKFQGKGFNPHIKYLLLKYCFEEAGMVRVELKTDVLNTAARRAMEKIGLKEEGVLRSHTLMTGGRRRDTIFYSVLRQEWDDMKAGNGWD